jgi:L-fucose mutarotase/ribose pyranase (RbsD/FucU family)
MTKKRTGWIMAVTLAASCLCCVHAAPLPERSAGWQDKLHQDLPLLGHRNWILIVDSAYPLQNSEGIETIETGAKQTDVLRAVLDAVDQSIHVRPVVMMDAELPFVPEADAPGAAQYRAALKGILGTRAVSSLPHEQLLRKVDEVSRSYKVLVLKTSETIPYTSVFLQLNCKYWSDDAEARLRTAMKQAASQSH